ncbi:hypothetical protein PENTCL1PPCAC_29110, partial [Pristionchus entomophagus]
LQYPYQRPGVKYSKKKDRKRTVHQWYKLLEEAARDALTLPSSSFHIDHFAPLHLFRSAPLRDGMWDMPKGTWFKVDVPPAELEDSKERRREALPSFDAECIHTIGYYLLMRWMGAREENVFWIHAANPALRSYEYCGEDGMELPPSCDWDIYNNLHDGRLSEDRAVGQLFMMGRGFDLKGNDIANKYSVGERVEIRNTTAFTFELMPAVVHEIIGRRVVLKYSGSDIIDRSLIKMDVRMDMDDEWIFPVGFASSRGLPLVANAFYCKHSEAVAKEKTSEPQYKRLRHMDADEKKVFSGIRNWSGDRRKWLTNARWKDNMMCEMHDRLDDNQSILKAARVIRVLKDGFLFIGPDGVDIEQDAVVLPKTSRTLFPVGYAKAHGITLDGPKESDEDVFDWNSYLKRKKYPKAPNHFFEETILANQFEVGMKLEAIDRTEKKLSPATVKAIKGRLILVSFDGWDESYDHLYDFRSEEIFPYGWGEMVGYPLEAPGQTIDVKEEIIELDEDSNDKRSDEW